MPSNTRSRGFASMDQEKQREIARKGGRAAHEKGTAHEFTSDEARAAGRKGGERVSADRHHMSRIGRLGGKSSAGRRQAQGGAMAGGSGQDMGGGASYPGAESSASARHHEMQDAGGMERDHGRAHMMPDPSAEAAQTGSAA